MINCISCVSTLTWRYCICPPNSSSSLAFFAENIFVYKGKVLTLSDSEHLHFCCKNLFQVFHSPTFKRWKPTVCLVITAMKQDSVACLTRPRHAFIRLSPGELSRCHLRYRAENPPHLYPLPLIDLCIFSILWGSLTVIQKSWQVFIWFLGLTNIFYVL